MISEFQGKNRWLSNFWPCSIRIGAYTFPTLENAYQACKCRNVGDWAKFVSLTPGQAKRLGKKVEIREDWEECRPYVMLGLLREKFKDPVLREKLLATKDDILIEGNTWGDIFWGICRGKGQNILGKLLMQVRNEIGGRGAVGARI